MALAVFAPHSSCFLACDVHTALECVGLTWRPPFVLGERLLEVLGAFQPQVNVWLPLSLGNPLACSLLIVHALNRQL